MFSTPGPFELIDPPDEARHCPEIAAALIAMRTAAPIGVSWMGFENIKAPTFVSLLDRAPSAPMLDAALAIKDECPTLNFTPLAIACLAHECAIEWRQHGPPPTRTALGRIWRRLTGQ